MKQEIQKFIDSLKNKYDFHLHSAKINGMQIDLFSCGVLLILRINQTIIHETLNRSYMKRILNEWKDGKRELQSIGNTALLIKAYKKKSKAIKTTQKTISDMFRKKEGWVYSKWNGKEWIESNPTGFIKARMKRRQDLIDSANNLLGNDSNFYVGGNWKNSVI